MKVKNFLIIALVAGSLFFAIRLAPAQDFPKSVTLLHTNNINGEIDPCPS